MPGLERERDVLAQREPVVRPGDDIGARLLLGLDAQLAQLGVGAAQLVDARLQPPLELAAVADVEHEPEADVAPVAAVVGHVAIEHPALHAVVADEPVGGLELRGVVERLRLVLHVFLVVGVDQVDPLAARLVSVHHDAAGELLAIGARADRVPVAVLLALQHVDVGVDGLEHVLELGLAGCERGGRGAARRDVRRDPDDLDGAARERLALGALAHPARHAVGAAQAVFDPRARVHHLLRHEGLVAGPIVRVHRRHPVLGVLVGLDPAQEGVPVRALVGLVVGALAVEPARVEVLLELDQQALDRLGAHQALVLAADVLDHAHDGAVAIGGRALAHVERAARTLDAILHLAAPVAPHVCGQPREFDEVIRGDGTHEVARLDALAAQPPGLDELAHQTALGQPRAVGSERGQSSRECGQRARARGSGAGMIDEWTHVERSSACGGPRLRPHVGPRAALPSPDFHHDFTRSPPAPRERRLELVQG